MRKNESQYLICTLILFVFLTLFNIPDGYFWTWLAVGWMFFPDKSGTKSN